MQGRMWNKWLLGVGLATFMAAGFVHAQTPPGVLIVGQVAEPKSLDPAADTAVNDFRILGNMYDGLTRYKDDALEPVPALATDWDISDDGMTYTFHLRDDVTFHDGTPFDAKAVKFNFDRMLDEDHPYHDTGPFPLAFFFSAIDSTEVVDDYTVRFQLSEPFAPLLANLAYPTGYLISPAAVEKYGKDVGEHPVGTGPFQFVEWKPNDKVVIERYDDYWDGKAAADAVVFRPITDSNTRSVEMLSGNLDIMLEVPADMVGEFTNNPEFAVHSQVGPHVWFLILNTQHGPLKDKKVRQAVNYAIDKQALVEHVLQNTASIAAGPVAPAFEWAYNDALDPYPYDPDKARALIEEAGQDGAELTFYATESGSGMLAPLDMATAIQADLNKVGLKVKIETYEWNTYLDKVNAGLGDAVDMAEMAWMTNTPDTLPYLTLRSDAVPDKGGFNSGYYANAEVDELLEKARRISDQDERATLYKDMQTIVYEDAPWAFVANWKQYAIAAETVDGFKLQPDFGYLPLKDVSKP